MSPSCWLLLLSAALPGTQPGTLRDAILAPAGAPLTACDLCHQTTPDRPAAPQLPWSGSTMALSARDPAFYAELDLVLEDRPSMADLCFRCHTPGAWLEGRASDPSDRGGMGLSATDLFGVSCDVCHRMVSPTVRAPDVDAINVLDRLEDVPPAFGNGMYVIDPRQTRRGPHAYSPAEARHPNLVPETLAWTDIDRDTVHPTMHRPFFRSAELCGTCHDASDPEECIPPATGALVQRCFPIDRTFTEWRHSVFSRRGEGGTCQACHMSGPLNGTRSGAVCAGGPEIEDDVHVHDFTGGNTFLPAMLLHMKARYEDCSAGGAGCEDFRAAVDGLYPASPYFLDGIDPAALRAAVERSKRALRRAAELSIIEASTSTLTVRVYNRTGHKLPTGHSLGRRMWLNVKFWGSGDQLLAESGRYEPQTGALHHDADLIPGTASRPYDTTYYTNAFGSSMYRVGRPTKVWQARLGAGESLVEYHVAKNDRVVMDNRIPPEGWDPTSYSTARAAPVIPPEYEKRRWQGDYGAAAGAPVHWDEIQYPVPPGTDRIEVTLYHQTASREWVEALRDANPNTRASELMAGGYNRGTFLYELWRETGRSAPLVMARLVEELAPDQEDQEPPNPVAPPREAGVDVVLDIDTELARTAEGARAIELFREAWRDHASPRDRVIDPSERDAKRSTHLILVSTATGALAREAPEGAVVHTVMIGAPHHAGGPGQIRLERWAHEADGEHTFITRREDLEGALLAALLEALEPKPLDYVLREERAIPAGAGEELEIPIDRTARRLTLLLSFDGAAPPELALVRPDGASVDLTSASRGDVFHRVVTQSFDDPDSAPGERGIWTLKILTASELSVRVHAIVEEDDLDYELYTPRGEVRAGTTLRLAARAMEGGRKVGSFERATVQVEAPSAWIGALLAESRNRPREEVLARLATRRSTLELTDDGTGGDQVAGDGLFSATIPNVSVPGHYRLRFTLAGRSRFGLPFQRVETRTLLVRIGTLDPRRSGLHRFLEEGIPILEIHPHDVLGNVLGPNFAPLMTVKASGQLLAVEDLDDGHYRVELPRGHSREDLVEISIDGETLLAAPVPGSVPLDVPWWSWLVILMVVFVAIAVMRRVQPRDRQRT